LKDVNYLLVLVISCLHLGRDIGERNKVKLEVTVPAVSSSIGYKQSPLADFAKVGKVDSMVVFWLGLSWPESAGFWRVKPCYKETVCGKEKRGTEVPRI
jgi:hypothetical protein